MNLIFHADDYGLSQGISDNILLCYDQGALNRVSLMANGYAYEYACQELKQRKELKYCVHLNLIEGCSLTKNSTLTDSHGYFNQSFASLCWANSVLKKQILQECEAQILRIKQTFSRQTIRVDSHQHCHMIPWIFKALSKQRQRFGIENIRCASDCFTMTDTCSAQPSSILKNSLLSLMHKLNSRYIDETLAGEHEAFWGLLYTGKQDIHAINKLHQRTGKKHYLDKNIEVLFHPGQAKTGEEYLWKMYPKLRQYYYSDDRLTEQQTLLNYQASKT